MTGPRADRALALALPLAIGCLAPEGDAPQAAPEAHCARCDRAWSGQELRHHEKYFEGLGLSM